MAGNNSNFQFRTGIRSVKSFGTGRVTIKCDPRR